MGSPSPIAWTASAFWDRPGCSSSGAPWPESSLCAGRRRRRRCTVPASIYAGVLSALGWVALRRRATPALTELAPFAIYGCVTYTLAFRAVIGPQFQIALAPLIILGAALLERCYHLVRDGAARWPDPAFGARRAAVALCALFLAGAFIVASEKRYYGSLL